MATADNEREVRELVDLTVVGPVQAELWVRSSLDHTDLFVRRCDVDPTTPSAAGTACCGSRPAAARTVYARNLGAGEPLGQATTMRAAGLEAFGSPMRPSAVQLPVVAFSGSDLRPQGRA